jgi:hypothetical protein
METTIPPAPESASAIVESAAPAAPAPTSTSTSETLPAAPAAPASPSLPVSKPHEEWAKAKGHVVTTIRKNRQGKVLSTVVRPDWRLAAMRAFHKLEVGQPMTEAEYDERLARVMAEPYGEHVRPTKWAPRQKPIKPGRSKAIRLRSAQRTR